MPQVWAILALALWEGSSRRVALDTKPLRSHVHLFVQGSHAKSGNQVLSSEGSQEGLCTAR